MPTLDDETRVLSIQELLDPESVVPPPPPGEIVAPYISLPETMARKAMTHWAQQSRRLQSPWCRWEARRFELLLRAWISDKPKHYLRLQQFRNPHPITPRAPGLDSQAAPRSPGHASLPHTGCMKMRWGS